MLIDAADYYARLGAALQQARRSILIIGWDFDARITLFPELGASAPALGEMLRSLVERQPQLEIRILVWSFATVHAPGAALPLLLGEAWQEHPRITVRLDTRHPFYGAHHQKIVCVDDSLAFVGGIDLTVGRWDTCDHALPEPRRIDPDGKEYLPVHDAQMAICGDAARAVLSVAHARWRSATAETLSVTASDEDLWPTGLEPDFVDVPVAISRTVPRWGGQREVREVEALTLDLLAAGQRSIYIEAQYLADARVGDLLADALAKESGPDVVVLVTHVTHGVLERWIMGGNRDRIIRRLRQADKYDRFRAYYPVIVGSDGECEVLLHSKLVIVDDRFIRIGSSNLNRRSTGLDTECDVSIEAHDPVRRSTIAGIRNRLLAEHLGAEPAQIAAALATEGSLVRAIESLNSGSRQLRPFSDIPAKGPTRLMFGTRILDPKRPFPFIPALWSGRANPRH